MELVGKSVGLLLALLRSLHGGAHHHRHLLLLRLHIDAPRGRTDTLQLNLLLRLGREHLLHLQFLLSFLLLDRVELRVHVAEICIESLVVLNLRLTADLLTHLAVPALRNHLGLPNVARPCLLRSLLNTVAHQHVLVGLLLELSALVGDLLHLRKDAETLVAIQCCVLDLRLER